MATDDTGVQRVELQYSANSDLYDQSEWMIYEGANSQMWNAIIPSSGTFSAGDNIYLNVWAEDMSPNANVGETSYPYSPYVMSGNILITQDTFQTIDGFGVSGAWVASHLYYSIDESTRQEILDALFTESGADMSILRSKVEPTNSGYDEGQRHLMEQAQQRGVNQFYSVPWTPPAEWKDTSNHLISDHYDDYAQYLSNYLAIYSETVGIPIKWISVQNEPDFTAAYESCLWSPEEMSSFVPILRNRLNNDGFGDVRIMAPEAMGWSQSFPYVDHLVNSSANQSVDVLASHGYWGQENNEQMDKYRWSIRYLAEQNGKTVWQTEWSDLYTEWSGDPDDPNVFGMNDGLIWAERIANDLIKANASAWLYWWIYNPGDSNKANEGLIVRTPDNDFLYPKRFYTFSHFSRFVRPGSQRVGVLGYLSRLRIVAFRSADLQQLIMIVVNPTDEMLPINLEFAGYDQLGDAQVFRTSATEDIEEILSGENIQDNVLSTDIAAKSVTTFLVPAAVGSLCGHPDCFGDLNGDCGVTVADIMEVANLWRCQSEEDCYNGRYDLDEDGDIDIVDIMLVVAHWGETCE